ncbi:hypothetical protein ILUMI_20034 [Ignelater luminosus]|uniref:Uncharacterized protein n=1 Tax=Ignelater luminosus TaxID=2038154 RepID=A0A8K0G4X8_IGNLU|nr:hypothetical protein ILUMI_20034 [Ignelater luminosus]
MNTLTVAIFACLAVYASAKPSGLWGHGHGHLPVVGASGIVSSGGAAGPAGVVNGHGAVGPSGIANAVGHAGVWGAGVWGGHDDGQWHGEGLLASQDWAGHGVHHGAIVAPGAAVIAPAAAAVVGHGLGLGLGHGLGLGLGHGAVVAGPAGAVISHGVHGAIGIHGHGHW